MTEIKNSIIEMQASVIVIADGECSKGKNHVFSLENGKIWTGQNDCADTENIARSDLSRALNYRDANGELKRVKGKRYGRLTKFGDYCMEILDRINELYNTNIKQEAIINSLKHENESLKTEIEKLIERPFITDPEEYAQYLADKTEYLKYKKEKEKKAELEAVKAAYAQTLREIEQSNITLEELDKRLRELECEVR